MKLKCIIADDEPVARKLLEEYISDIDFLELTGKTENALKAGALLDASPADLLFLDINMPRLSGIEFLKVSKDLPPVIITTAYAEYALDGFELDVLDYLLKPFSFERFLKACNKAKDYHALKRSADRPGSKEADYLFVKHNSILEKVFYNELLYAEAMLNYVILHTDSKKMIVYLTMKSVMEQLPANQFLRVHKSFIVNTARVSGIEGNQVLLGKTSIPISQNYHDAAVKEIVKDRVMKR